MNPGPIIDVADLEDNMTFVGIDQAQVRTGLCVLRPGPTIILATLHIKSKGPDRIVEYRDRLSEFLEDVGPVRLAALEAGAFEGGGRVFQLGGVSAITKLVLCDHGVSYLEPTPQHAKMFMTGMSDAPKHMMVNAAQEETGQDMKEDEADAYALASIARAFATEQVRTRIEARVLKKLREQGRFHER